MPALEAKALELRAEAREVRVDVDGNRVRPHPDEPVLLDDRERPEPVLVPRQTREALLARNVDEGAVEIVGPAVIRACEGPLDAAALGHARPAVAADVGERVQPARCRSHQQDRRAGVVVGQVRARRRELAREGDEQRALPEEHALLQSQALLGGVRGDRVPEHGVGHRGRAGVEVVEKPLHELRAGVRSHGSCRGPQPAGGCNPSPGPDPLL